MADRPKHRARPSSKSGEHIALRRDERKAKRPLPRDRPLRLLLLDPRPGILQSNRAVEDRNART